VNYAYLNKLLLNSFTKYFPKTINRKLFRIYKIYFVPTFFKILPKNFYPITTNFNDQEEIIVKYTQSKKLINQTTFKNLDFLLNRIFKKKFFNFIDIGGDNIDLYLHLNRINNINQYFVYNFKKIILIFKRIKTKYLFNNFFPIDDINKIKQIDFVYFGSCIQYFKFYKYFLSKIFFMKPKYILFSGTSFFLDKINADKIIVKQTNILPHLIYLYFFNLQKFIKHFEDNGYKVIFKRLNNSDKINYKNFKGFINHIKYYDILFKKI